MLSLPVTSVSYAECSCRYSLTRPLGANINMAINACNPEGGRLLDHLNNMEMIKEFLNDGYCGQVDNLRLVGEVPIHAKQRETVRVFATEGMFVEPERILIGLPIMDPV